jgi:hypothetical protein
LKSSRIHTLRIWHRGDVHRVSQAPTNDKTLILLLLGIDIDID